jgi:hypothetical protein
MKARAVLGLLGVLFGCVSASGVPIQYGIRVNHATSIQWFGDRIYFEGGRRGVTQTAAGSIHEVWPGPVPGAFAIYADQGIGVLAGRGAVLLSKPTRPDAILRSCDPQTLWMAHYDSSIQRTILSRWPSQRRAVAVLEIRAHLRDFDVAFNGTIAFLADDGSAFLARSPAEVVSIPAPTTEQPIRIFLTYDLSELALLSEQHLCRLATATKEWHCEPFDPLSQAVVRHAWSGRPALEDRLGTQ